MCDVLDRISSTGTPKLNVKAPHLGWSKCGYVDGFGSGEACNHDIPLVSVRLKKLVIISCPSRQA